MRPPFPLSLPIIIGTERAFLSNITLKFRYRRHHIFIETIDLEPLTTPAGIEPSPWISAFENATPLESVIFALSNFLIG
jgi:hypothetical protein